MAKPDFEEFMGLAEASVAKHLFNNRTIVLSEGIGSETAKKVISQLLAFNATDPNKDILMILNSPGGEVSSGFAIYDTIKFIKPDVKIVVAGLAASIATVILLGAPKQYRYSLPNSRLLIHQPLIAGAVQGQASDLEITAREIVKTREKLALLYNKETGQTIERVRRDIERDYWMTTEEAKEYGLITKIIQNWDEI